MKRITITIDLTEEQVKKFNPPVNDHIARVVGFELNGKGIKMTSIKCEDV
jgi:hypothetical protein